MRVLKYEWAKWRREMSRQEEELQKFAVCSRFYSTYTVSTLPKKLLKGLETSKEEDK
jgi:hypothetical protein